MLVLVHDRDVGGGTREVTVDGLEVDSLDLGVDLRFLE